MGDKFCGGTLTEMDCCGADLDRQCGYGQGDCDADEQCAGDLKCGSNNCIEFRSWAEPTADCCVTIPKENFFKIDVKKIKEIKEVIANTESTICSHGQICNNPSTLGGSDLEDLMAWDVKFEPKSTSNIQFTFERGNPLKSGRVNKYKRIGNRNKINRKKLSKSMPKGAKGSKDTSKGKLRKKTLHKERRQTRSTKK